MNFTEIARYIAICGMMEDGRRVVARNGKFVPKLGLGSALSTKAFPFGVSESTERKRVTCDIPI